MPVDPREHHLDDPHMRPLMDLVRELRSRGLDTPNIDPNDGGVNARALFLLETPGPRAVGSGFVSRDNPDLSARNIGWALDGAGFARTDVLLWNVVPYYVSSIDQNRNVTTPQIRNAISDLQAFVDRLPSLSVVIFCGRKAQKAKPHLRFPAHVRTLSTFHPGAQAYNHAKHRDHIHRTFGKDNKRIKYQSDPARRHQEARGWSDIQHASNSALPTPGLAARVRTPSQRRRVRSCTGAKWNRIRDRAKWPRCRQPHCKHKGIGENSSIVENRDWLQLSSRQHPARRNEHVRQRRHPAGAKC